MMNSTEISIAEYNHGNYRRAIIFAEYGIARDDEDAQAWRTLGLAASKLSLFHQAIDALEHASLLRPLSNSDRIELAIAYGSIGRKELSRDLLMAIAVDYSSSWDELLRIAAGLESVDAPRLAMEACRQAGKKAPDAPEVHYQMGYYSLQCGHPPSVSEALIRYAIDLDPGNVHYRVGLTSLLIQLDRQAEAIEIVAPLFPRSIHQVTCLCCLKRIANLCFDVGAIDHAKQCAQRIAHLRHPASYPSKPTTQAIAQTRY